MVIVRLHYLRLLFQPFCLGDGGNCNNLIPQAVKPYGILPEDIPGTFDINMNYTHDCERHRWVIKEPISRPGDYIEFRVEMDCIVGMSNCPDDMTPCNARRCKPVKIEIYEE